VSLSFLLSLKLWGFPTSTWPKFSRRWRRTYDSKGRLSVEVFGNTRTTSFYDEQDRITETLSRSHRGLCFHSPGAMDVIW